MYTCSLYERNRPALMDSSPIPDSSPVAVIGAGSIGTAFALVFAIAGHTVRLYDPDPARLDAAPATIRDRLADLQAAGLTSEPLETIFARIQPQPELAAALDAAAYVQECAPENLALKQELFATLDAQAPPDAILASSSSAIPASQFAADLEGRARCLVVHPGNPPTLIKVAEIVPAPFTATETVERTAAFLQACGLSPVLVQREVEGFVYNRLQGALLREAYCLVRDGVASVEDIDRLVRDGLGFRWSVVGPFETVDLNTRGGIASHAEKMGPAYARMGAERGQHDPWTPDLVARVAAARRRLLPLENWEERVAWRDRQLMALLAERRARAEKP